MANADQSQMTRKDIKKMKDEKTEAFYEIDQEVSSTRIRS
jgi:hypothetical protein